MLSLREFFDKYKPPRDIFSGIFDEKQLCVYLYSKKPTYMSLERAVQISEISIIWLIKNDYDPKDKIDIASLIHPKNREAFKSITQPIK